MDAVFEVRHGASEKVWRVYADGRIEGFPEGCVVVNRVPLHAMNFITAIAKTPTEVPAMLRDCAPKPPRGFRQSVRAFLRACLKNIRLPLHSRQPSR